MIFLVIGAVLLAALCGIALLTGMHALTENCNHRSIKITSAFVFMMGTLYLSMGLHNVNTGGSHIGALVLSATTADVGFILIITLSTVKRKVTKTTSNTHAIRF